ncbi:cryptochrome/photolyase family protein [Ruegeria marina]|uniref:cryptochrome/photolyase family protein n=1 Tax=Ruegeria marina TaxID=639004 RepID=UPI00159F8F38|nr:cryptochrome/photolyase family protein [Ruegeria marina]
MTRLILVLGDQLSESLTALASADKARDLVIMAEVAAETEYVAHHPRKIALILSAMRKFAARLRAMGWGLAYTRLDDPENTGSVSGELLRRASETGAVEVLLTTPGEWRLIQELQDLPLAVRFLPDARFVSRRSDFRNWAKGRKQLRMEWFYREMRRKTGLLMEGDRPVGGKWNYDMENRKVPPKDAVFPVPMRFEPDAITEEVLACVEERFGEHFGTLRPFWFATDRVQALAALDHFVSKALPWFGDYQDAMLTGERFLNHAAISVYLNIGLLEPMEVCRAAEAAWRAGRVPLNSVEGFIRQIIGWREYVRGIYFLEGPGYTTRNFLEHDRELPPLYWGADTRMHCLAEAVAQTRDEAYAHHIQRLMVTGNFALLAGVDPQQVHEWYLAVYADAFEWVEAPNTLGMSQFADGGLVASKPYVSGGAYINRMSDYCKRCFYDVQAKTGPNACPFNALYWHFLDRHRDRFADNPRMGNAYRTWDRMDETRRRQIIADASAFLEKLERRETV